MKAKFISDICDAYLIEQNFYSKYKKQKVIEIHEQITKDLLFELKKLREDDLETYSSFYDNSILSQQQTINTYLMLTYNDVIEESLSLIIMSASVMLGIIMSSFKIFAPSLFYKVKNKMGRILTIIGNSLRKSGRSATLQYSIAQRNAEKCYHVCKVDKNMSRKTYKGILKGNFDSTAIPAKNMKDAICLRNCYITFLMQSINLLAKSYFTCLKSTKNYSVVDSLSKENILSTLVASNLSIVCIEYFHDLRKVLNEFYDILDILFRPGVDDVQKNKVISDLSKLIYDTKNKITYKKKGK